VSTLEPFYFGPPEKPLWGCYHDPDAEVRRDCAIVVCYPMGHEYIQFHRACRQLASLLCNGGYPVLRFDFYGCGDSSGDCEEGRIDRWLADISAAVGEIRRRCGSMKICLAGLRLGGALSTLAGAARGDIDAMVLWDAVVQGRTYVEELRSLQREMLQRAHLRPAPDETRQEALGFILTDHLLRDLEGIDLLANRRKPANKILVIESHDQPDQNPLTQHLKNLHSEVTHQHLPNPQFWHWVEDFTHVPVPQQILQSVKGWISEVYP
jgi:uncharacterized protein